MFVPAVDDLARSEAVQQTGLMRDQHGAKRSQRAAQPSALKPQSKGRLSRLARHVGRVGLGVALCGAGLGHLTALREEFQAQVPDWIPADADFVVVASGVVEIGLGTALVLAPRSMRPAVGTATAVFFVMVFPGNIAQYTEGTDAFGLDSDRKRLTRLFFQPALVAWALWSTSAWSWLRAKLK